MHVPVIHRTKPPSSPLSRMISPYREAETSATAATFLRSCVALVATVAAFSQAEGFKPLHIFRPILLADILRARVRVEWCELRPSTACSLMGDADGKLRHTF